MKRETIVLVGAVASATLCACQPALAQSTTIELPPFRRIAGSTDDIPGTDKKFGSFNQPSVNRNGVVVFRARSVGSSSPVSGIFIRRMGADGQPTTPIYTRGDLVPEPNNSDEAEPGKGEGTSPTGFREFPSIPRIDADSEVIATRGISTPVWIYPLEDGSETRVGTTGVFVWANDGESTAMSQLGAVRDAASGALVFPEYSVPDAPEGTRFDMFPGSPAIADGRYIVSKGNWTDPETSLGKTGVYVHDLRSPMSPMRRLASSDTVIPGQDPELKDPVRFGSTAPPSAADGKAVFLAVDVEEAPTMGGLYAAPLAPQGDGAGEVQLDPLVMIGDPVPGGGEGDVFTRVGEGLSFNGRYVGFWAAWGTEMMEITLTCPVDGNPDIIAYCNEQHPSGFTVEVPVHQGVFVYDLQTRNLTMAAQTGDAGITDLVYWNFSGRAPGTGGGGGGGGGGEGGGEGEIAEEEDGELARWRSASFVTVEAKDGNGGGFRVAFKAKSAGSKSGDTDGIYLVDGPGGGAAQAYLTTGMPASAIDPELPETSSIATLTLERESLRDGWFVIGASTVDDATKEGFAGIYASGIRRSGNDFNGDGRSDVFWHSRASGRSSFWAMEGLVWNRGGYTSIDPEPTWDAVGTADFDGDRAPEILWRDSATGAFYAWKLEGGIVVEDAQISNGVELFWKVIALQDLNGDRMEDVVFQNEHTGEVRGWLMGGLTKLSGGLIAESVGMRFLGSGDFDADSRGDLLWQREDGTVEGWRMDGLAIQEAAAIGNAHAVTSNWQVAAMGDLDGDSHTDVVWHDPEIGWVAAWLMDGLARRQGGYISQTVGPGWSITDARDLDGDGRSDVLWRSDTTGDVSGWLMEGLTIRTRSHIRRVEQHWEAIR